MQFVNSNWFVRIFFITYFLIGMVIVRDYGLSWDEPISRLNGIKAYRYVFENDQSIFSYRDKYYGTAFELPLYALERWTGITDSEQIFFWRHTLTFFVFYVGVIAWYSLCKSLFHSRFLGWIGALLLILYPRIFADSFYNSKDIPFLAVFVLAIYTGMWFVRRPGIASSIAFAVVAAVATDIRIIGGLVHVLILSQFIYTHRKTVRHMYGVLTLYGIASLGFTYAFWPILWSNPIVHFFEAVKFMGDFSQFQNNILFFGEFIPAQHAPWQYLFVFIGITTPIVYLLLMILGIAVVVKKKDQWGYMFISWLSVPIAAALISRPSLYDGWRQFYFVYPAIIGIALFGISALWSLGKNVRVGVVMILSLVFVSTIHFMLRSHPYQNVYFNSLTGGVRGAEQQFDLDYWGLAFKNGLIAIAKQDLRPAIPVFFAFGIKAQVDFLPAQYRRFIPVPNAAEADYILSNFRWQDNIPPYPEIYSESVDGVKIMGVYKVKQY